MPRAGYQRPYDPQRPVVRLDEKSKELHSTPRGTLPMEQGQEAREDYEYARHGTANLFLAVEPLVGRRSVRVTARRTARDFAEELHRMVDEEYPDAAQIVLVMDNLNTHTPACLYERFAPEEARRIAERLEWHYRTWQLADHRGVRALGTGPAVPEPAHRRSGDPGAEGGCLGDLAQCRPRHHRLAVHRR